MSSTRYLEDLIKSSFCDLKYTKRFSVDLKKILIDDFSKNSKIFEFEI